MKLFNKCLLSLCLFIISGIALNAQPNKNVSPQQQIAIYKAQVNSAENENDAAKMAYLYGEMVRLCKENSTLENELPESLFNYGMWSTYAGNHQVAIETLIELLDMPDKTDDESLLTLKARAYNTLGTIHFFSQQWDNALAYYQKSYDMAVKLQNYQGISIAENNIGNIYQKKGNNYLAIEHYLRSLELQKEIGDKETICNTYYNLASCYYGTANFKQTLDYLNLALNLSKEIGNNELEALSLIGLATYYVEERKMFDEAAKHIANAETIAKESGYNQVLAEVFKARSIIDEKRGYFASALNYYKQHKAISDTLLNENSINQLNEYEVRYKTQEKELQIFQQQIVIDQQKNNVRLFAGGLIASLLLLIMLVYIIVLRTHRNRQLSEINAIKDQFFSIISHDLRNPVIAQRDALQTLVDCAHQLDANALSDFFQKMLKSADGLTDLLKNLLDWATIQTGRDRYHPAPFNLASALQPDIEVIKSMAEHKEIIFEAQMPPTAVITADANMIVTVVRNLLTNAIKFTATSGKVLLQIDENNGKCSIAVHDTGIGMTPEQVQNLFRINQRHSREGTAGEQSCGLGLIVCRDMLRKHNIELYVESEEGKGSRFWFEV